MSVIPTTATITEMGVVISAVAAAVAATMSYRSVREQRQARLLAERPTLLSQGFYPSGGALSVAVHNAGGGVAHGVIFAFVVGESYVAGRLGLAFMKPGEEIVVDTALVPSEDEQPRGALVCTDVNRRSFVFSYGHEVRELRYRLTRKPRYGDVRDAVRAFYPEIDLSALTQVTILGQRVVRSGMDG